MRRRSSASSPPSCPAASPAAAGRPAALDGLRLAEIGHLADLVAVFAEQTVKSRKSRRMTRSAEDKAAKLKELEAKKAEYETLMAKIPQT